MRQPWIAPRLVLSLCRSAQNGCMTDDELKALVASLAVSQAKTDAQLARTDAKLDRLAEMYGTASSKIDRLAEMYGGSSNNQGAVAEEFFLNSLAANPVLLGVRYDFIDRHLSRHHGKLQDEFDIVMINGSVVALIEVKYKVHPRDLERLLHKKAPSFWALFPQYADFRLRLGLAAFAIEDGLKAEALSQGMIVLQRKGDQIETCAA